MLAPHQLLWNKLQAYTISPAGAMESFLVRLSRDQRWTPGFARSTWEEYKKFILLAALAGHAVTPSEAIDAVWHLHLLYTRSYWNDLCGAVLGFQLHHEPALSPKEKPAFQAQYDRTLASYQRVFGIPAPAEVWPVPDSRKPNPVSRANFLRHYGRELKLFSTAGFIVGVGATIVGCAASMPAELNVFDYTGPRFLLFYILSTPLIIGAAYSLRWFLSEPGGHPAADFIDPYALAYLSGGGKRVALAATAYLIEQKLVDIDAENKNVIASGTISGKLHPVEIAVYEAAASPRGVRFSRLPHRLSAEYEALRETLEVEGLRVSRSHRASAYGWPLLLASLPIVMGATKIYIGMNRDRPVTILMVLTVMAAVAAALAFFPAEFRSRRAFAFLRRQRAALKRNLKLTLPADEALVLSVALLGLPSIRSTTAGMALAPLFPKSTDAGGSSCGGGSGCGGGGSGCGGCGGH